MAYRVVRSCLQHAQLLSKARGHLDLGKFHPDPTETAYRIDGLFGYKLVTLYWRGSHMDGIGSFLRPQREPADSEHLGQ